jgi:predicted nucleic acid-binding protein
LVLLVDTNVWLAAGDRRAARHRKCAGLLDDHSDELAAPVPVIAETGWLLLDRAGPAAQAAFVAAVCGGRLEVVELTAADWVRVHELISTYADLPLDLIDASLVAVAERHGITVIATLNHRDFRVVRPAHCDAFELVP